MQWRARQNVSQATNGLFMEWWLWEPQPWRIHIQRVHRLVRFGQRGWGARPGGRRASLPCSYHPTTVFFSLFLSNLITPLILTGWARPYFVPIKSIHIRGSTDGHTSGAQASLVHNLVCSYGTSPTCQPVGTCMSATAKSGNLCPRGGWCTHTESAFLDITHLGMENHDLFERKNTLTYEKLHNKFKSCCKHNYGDYY